MSIPSLSSTTPDPPKRQIRRVGLGALAVLLAVTGIPAILGFASVAALLYVPCNASTASPADFGLAWEDVTLTTRRSDDIRGYFLPGSENIENDPDRLGAAIIIPPPYNGDRGTRLHEAAVLARAGYAVLTYDSRRCASMGPSSLGYKEVTEIADALAYLNTRPEIDPARIGVLGFSSAGATAIVAAAQMPEIRAVVAEGGYSNLVEQALAAEAQNGILGHIYIESFKTSYRILSGGPIERLDPLGVISRIAPRPVLLVYGSRESTLNGARAQQAAAGLTAELWIVEGAGHGDYLQVAPEDYAQRVVAALDRALLTDE